MHEIKKYKELIIQPGEIYTLDGKDYRVITATSKMICDQADTLAMSEHVWWLDDVETGKRRYIPESELVKELPKYNRVVRV